MGQLSAPQASPKRNPARQQLVAYNTGPKLVDTNSSTDDTYDGAKVSEYWQ